MHDETHGVIEHLVLRKGTMAALVCQDPDTGEDEALHGGVGYPGCEPQVWVGEERDVGDGEVHEGCAVEVVADNIGHGAEDGGLEAVCGNGIVDLLHGEVGEFKDVSVEIEMLALGLSISNDRHLCFGDGGDGRRSHD